MKSGHTSIAPEHPIPDVAWSPVQQLEGCIIHCRLDQTGIILCFIWYHHADVYYSNSFTLYLKKIIHQSFSPLGNTDFFSKTDFQSSFPPTLGKTCLKEVMISSNRLPQSNVLSNVTIWKVQFQVQGFQPTLILNHELQCLLGLYGHLKIAMNHISMASENAQALIHILHHAPDRIILHCDNANENA